MNKEESSFIQMSVLKTNSKSSSEQDYSSIALKSVVMKVKEEDRFYFVTYKTTKIPDSHLFGVEILISTSMDATTPVTNFNSIKEVLEKSIRLITLAYSQKYDNLTDENKQLYSEKEFVELKSNLLRLSTGRIMSFLYYHNKNITTSHEQSFQKDILSIFDEPEKPTFIRSNAGRFDTRSDLSNFILLYDRSVISEELLKLLKEYLFASVNKTKVKYNTFVEPKTPVDLTKKSDGNPRPDLDLM